jgi:hypothetical protein
MVSKHLKQQNSKAARNVPRSSDYNVGTELILLLVYQLKYLSGVGSSATCINKGVFGLYGKYRTRRFQRCAILRYLEHSTVIGNNSSNVPVWGGMARGHTTVASLSQLLPQTMQVLLEPLEATLNIVVGPAVLLRLPAKLSMIGPGHPHTYPHTLLRNTWGTCEL